MLEVLLLPIFAAAAAATAATAQAAYPVAQVSRSRASNSPYIEVWTNNNEVFRRGDRVRVYFRTESESYVTIFRVNTDGRVRVLFPRGPWEDNYARGDRRYEVQAHGNRSSFIVDDYPGQGYLFAVASADPFNFHNIVSADHWDYRRIAAGGRITGDPYVSLMGLIDLIVPPNYSDYSYDVLPYYVEQRYEYPRFLCYDCHGYASYSYWNPYRYSCTSFRLVIYNDPYYYPARYYSGVRVVYQRPARILPRYIFRAQAPGRAYVTRQRRRPTDQGGRRVSDVGITSRDVGGPGSIATPINPSGRRRVTRGTGQAATRPGRQQGDIQQQRPRTGVEPRGGGAETRSGRRTFTPGTPSQRPAQQKPRPRVQAQPPARRQQEPRRAQPQQSPRREPQRAEPQLERRGNNNRPSNARPQRSESRRPARAADTQRTQSRQPARAVGSRRPRSSGNSGRSASAGRRSGGARQAPARAPARTRASTGGRRR